MHSINSFFMSTVLTAWGYHMSLLEILGFVTSVVGVWLSIYGPRSTWPWWNISSLLYGYFYIETKVFGSAALQLVFIAGGFWGWFGWGKEGAIPGKLSKKAISINLVAYLASWLGLSSFLIARGAAASKLDAFCVIGSCIAQYLMVKEKFEAWPLWFIVDSVYTYEFFSLKYYLTAILYILFVLMAIAGWKRWYERAQSLKVAEASLR